MRLVYASVVLATVSVGACWLMRADAQSPKPGPGFAVVELFSSQGCSSCPPAEELLSKLTADARKNNLAVYPIAFHVDYWNSLGWTDPFSSADYSTRQKAYGSALNLRQIYTPQMIVNGSVEFVGSDASKVEEQITSALATAGDLNLRIILSTAGRMVSVKYQLNKADPLNTLNFALVERGLRSQVSAGENTGRLLQQDNVARLFRSIPAANQAGFIELKVPSEVNTKNTSMIAFVQNSRTMKISAATMADLEH